MEFYQLQLNGKHFYSRMYLSTGLDRKDAFKYLSIALDKL